MNKERLLKLAEHLEHGKLGHERFNFSAINTDLDPKSPTNGCGTVGCALGECPIVWPAHWQFTTRGEVKLLVSHGRSGVSFVDAAQFFDVDMEEVDHLFVPRNQDVDRFGGERLTGAATKEQVAANIRAFVEKIEKMELTVAAV